MPLLAIETSCDDTCAAVLDGSRILSNVISSQADHERYGGVVPEVASRHHLELAVPVVEAALTDAGVGFDDLDSVAVTAGPGLIGALLVGLSTAKAIAAPRRLLVPTDHLHGHVAANFLDPDPLEPPFLCLIASGGHTMLAGVRDHHGFEVLGETLDDAAGEAIDKAARLLGLGFPGGPELERLAADGDPQAFTFPVAMSRDPGLDFSFSGLKTALVYISRELGRKRPQGGPPIWLPATRLPWLTSWWPSSGAPWRPGNGRRSPWVVVWRQTGRSAGRWPGCASRRGSHSRR